MSPEASAIWMWVAINVSFLTIVFAALWWGEKQDSIRFSKGWDNCIEDLKECCQFNQELLKSNTSLHEANTQLMAIIHEQDNDQGESWKHES